VVRVLRDGRRATADVLSETAHHVRRVAGSGRPGAQPQAGRAERRLSGVVITLRDNNVPVPRGGTTQARDYVEQLARRLAVAGRNAAAAKPAR
jgi:hypothetical protein